MPIVGTTAFTQASEALELVRSLLADLDSVARSLITPTGAVRVSAISTITTQSAHGLVPGDMVFVQAVANTTFNGTWLVATVPTSTTFTYVQAGESDASSGTGYLDQIGRGDVYTDTVLLPMMNASYRKVQRKLMEDGSPTAKDEVEYLDVAADTRSITDTTDPQLPADFLAPRLLFERMNGQKYRKVDPVDDIEHTPQQSLNYVFEWRTDGLYLPGAVNALDLKLSYFCAKPNLSGADSYILIRGGGDAVAYYTAALASNSRSNPQAGGFQTLADAAMDELLDMQAHSGQYQPRRRQPYGGRCGMRWWR